MLEVILRDIFPNPLELVPLLRFREADYMHTCGWPGRRMHNKKIFNDVVGFVKVWVVISSFALLYSRAWSVAALRIRLLEAVFRLVLGQVL